MAKSKLNMLESAWKYQMTLEQILEISGGYMETLRISGHSYYPVPCWYMWRYETWTHCITSVFFQPIFCVSFRHCSLQNSYWKPIRILMRQTPFVISACSCQRIRKFVSVIGFIFYAQFDESIGCICLLGMLCKSRSSVYPCLLALGCLISFLLCAVSSHFSRFVVILY